MGVDIAALMGIFGLTGAFAVVGAVLAAWMAWRIVEKAGLPGWTGLGAVLLTLAVVSSIVPLILRVGVRLHALAARRAGERGVRIWRGSGR